MRILLLFGLITTFVNAYGQDTQRVVKIPVIFHILYADSIQDNGINAQSRDRGNNTQYLTTEKIMAELKDLHDDFLLLNADTSDVLDTFKSRIGNPRVEFFLADTVLQKGGEKGIIRVPTKRNEHKLYTQSKIINPRRFLNVYVGNIGSSFVNSYPWTDSKDDAVHLDFTWVGLDYRLLTHEVGHWLGLWHIYGGNGKCKGDNCKGEGDEVADTPPQRNCTNTICVYCPPDVPDQSCEKGKSSNYNNYMDYSGCRRMFTQGQVKKMRGTLTDHRSELWNNSQLK
ncbi:Pregnancy-associated plasma protein-A [Chitinophaga rupis]|uniref:Pregnancy-associated plasma protein-A n=1 Tax=Chitinophaga rupis TaxID=573321 RepID=A0A1H8C784_9BACT|nr:M43 family zinc metalloprotease [Chitinophaga rupis]SEM90933.1 Pregnancy-associated plasma protein-A [Chitinophaga rupis]